MTRDDPRRSWVGGLTTRAWKRGVKGPTRRIPARDVTGSTRRCIAPAIASDLVWSARMTADGAAANRRRRLTGHSAQTSLHGRVPVIGRLAVPQERYLPGQRGTVPTPAHSATQRILRRWRSLPPSTSAPRDWPRVERRSLRSERCLFGRRDRHRREASRQPGDAPSRASVKRPARHPQVSRSRSVTERAFSQGRRR